jgi:hypothetical protein
MALKTGTNWWRWMLIVAYLTPFLSLYRCQKYHSLPILAHCHHKDQHSLKENTDPVECVYFLGYGSGAERVGFEPTVPMKTLRFSRPVHSTTLPPLLYLKNLSTISISAKISNILVEKSRIVIQCSFFFWRPRRYKASPRFLKCSKRARNRTIFCVHYALRATVQYLSK